MTIIIDLFYFALFWLVLFEFVFIVFEQLYWLLVQEAGFKHSESGMVSVCPC
jgi:hypothetical protein